MRNIVTAILFLGACQAPESPVQDAPAGETRVLNSTTWRVFNLTPSTDYRAVYLSGVGQIAIEAERGDFTMWRGTTTYVSRGRGRVHRGSLPAGWYQIKFYGTSGRAVIEDDVYGETLVRTVAPGVTWTREIGHNPGYSVNMLRVDASILDSVDVYDDDTRCRSVSSMGRRSGAIAGINGTFYERTWPVTCLQHGPDGGAIRYSGYAQGDLHNSRPAMSFPSGYIEQVSDIDHASGPSALTGSVRLLPTLEQDDDGQRHPRTAIGTFPDGDIGMLTIDGRTEAGLDLTLQEAAWVAQLWGMDEAMNLDGGGSTTMWIDGATLSGVVNYPSDWHMGGYPDHNGARLVSDGVFVW
ncbi:MAG: phosphodiester glycosidase family protein [Myxococcales bacterium FL481]|nr:MAG: phosphodiester glycosidase family protein [Myxococcales bacterium FL481]